MKNRICKRVGAVLMAFVFVFGIMLPFDHGLSLSVTASAKTYNSAQEARAKEGTKNISDDVDFWNDINIDLSFAHQVRTATNYANRQIAAGNGIAGHASYNGYNASLNMSNVAPFFGYTEGEVEYDELNSPTNTRGQAGDGSSLYYSRDQFQNNIVGNESTGSRFSEGSAYHQYGLLLSMIGFDDVGSGAVDASRSLYGTMALGSYYAASSVNTLFQLVFDFLYATNPFMFFAEIDTIDSGETALDAIYNGATGELTKDGGNVDNSIGVLAKYFGGIFNTFTSFAWTVSIPLSILFIIITFFLTKRGRWSIGGKIKQLLIKIIFVAMGIPILGAGYTQVLIELKDTRAMSDEYLAQAVSYTFLDFSKWVETNRLSPSATNGNLAISIGSTSNGTSTDSVVSARTWRNLRKMCNNLNEANGLFNFSTEYLTVTNTGVLLKEYIYNTGASAVKTLSTQANSYGTSDYDNRQAVLDLLEKYKDGTKYSATTFESAVVAWMQSEMQDVNAPGTTAFGDMLALSFDKYSFSANSERQIHGLTGNVEVDRIKWYDTAAPTKAETYATVAQKRFAGTDFANVGYNIWNNGSIAARQMNAIGATNSEALNESPAMGFQFYSKTATSGSDVVSGYDCSKVSGFSTMSMYTYLTTEFTQNSAITYGAAPSVYTQVEHYAVNLIGGNSIMQFAFFVNMMAVLLGYFILAVFYVFRTAFDILFKGIQVMGHSLLAAAGFYKSIGTCICMVVNMIAQLFVTVVFFSFMTDLMFMTTSIFDNFFFDAFNGLFTGTENGGQFWSSSTGLNISPAYAAEAVVIISSLLSTFVMVFFASFAIKFRSLIMSSVNSMVEEIVGTLLGVNLSGTSDGVAGGMAKAAFNDATSIMGAAAAVGGGVALADGMTDIANDIGAAIASDEPAGEITAADAAVNPTSGAAFNGGKGARDDDPEAKAEGMHALENGLGERDDEKSGSEKLLDHNREREKEEAEARGGGGGQSRSDNAGSGGRRRGDDANVDADTNIDEVVEATDEIPDNEDAMPREDVTADADANEKTDDTATDGQFDENGRYIGATPQYRDLDEHWGRDKSEDAQTAEQTGVSDDTDQAAAGADSTNASDNARYNTFGDESNAVSEDDMARETTESTGVSAEPMATGDIAAENSENAAVETPESGISFDATRGLVMTKVNEDGTTSDVAVGLNGVSIGSTDENGNETVSTISTEGMQVAYTGADGTTETTTTTFDGLNSSVTTSRTDADGNSEVVTSGLGGTISKRTETTEDGSVRETVINSNGETTITTNNPTTGYTAVEEISADGSARKTETVNGVTTETVTNASGTVTSQSVTYTDANGKEVSTSYTLGDNGDVITTTEQDGYKTVRTTASDGSASVVQTSVLSNGSIAETTMNYASDGSQIGDHSTVIRSSNGQSVIGSSSTITGTDDNGTYTTTVAETAMGSVEIKDYGNGHTVTTETALNGDKSVTTVTSDGNYRIVETDASTGAETVTSISSSGGGTTISYDTNGREISREELKPGSDGALTYVNAAGGVFTMEQQGTGDERAHVVSASYVTGGSQVVSTNMSTGNVSSTISSGVGDNIVSVYDKDTGSTKVSGTTVGGNTIEATYAANGDYNEVVTMPNGGTRNVVRTGTGDEVVERVVETDGAGNTVSTTSKNGSITYRSGSNANGASYIQEQNDNGSWTTVETLVSGDKINTVVESDGDFTKTISYANGSYRRESLNDGVYGISTSSVTGIETSAVRQGSVVTRTVSMDGAVFKESADLEAGTLTQHVEIADQRYEIISNSDGSTDTVFSLSNGAVGTYSNKLDGTQVNTVRQADGSKRVETITVDGGTEVIYVDSAGNKITDQNETTVLNDLFAKHTGDFNSSMKSARDAMSKLPKDMSTSSLAAFEVAAPAATTVPGMMTDYVPSVDDAVMSGAFGDYDTRLGGSATTPIGDTAE